MLGKKKNVTNKMSQEEQQLSNAEAIVNQEKARQLNKRDAKKRAEYKRLIQSMTPEAATALQAEREAAEIMQYMEKRSKDAIKKAARKRMGMASKVKSALVGAVLGGATYLGLNAVVDTEEREITRPLTQSEYRNAVAKNYLMDGDKVENDTLTYSGMDWNEPDWYNEWLSVLRDSDSPYYGKMYRDLSVIDNIMNDKDYSYAFSNIVMNAPHNKYSTYFRYTIVGTDAEREEIYTYAFQKKWGIDPSTMSMTDDADKVAEILRTQGMDTCEEFIDNLSLYRVLVPQNSEYYDNPELVGILYHFDDDDNYAYSQYDNFGAYLDAKEQQIIESSYSITGVDGYSSTSDFLDKITQAVAAGDVDAKNIWYEYITINQSRVMLVDDYLFYSTPCEVLSKFGIDSTDAMYQKYAELGSQEATFARVLMMDHPGCNTFHSDGSVHLTDSGTLTGEALIKFQEDVAYYQDLIDQSKDITALEYANNIYEFSYNKENVVDIDPTVTDVVPGADPITHVGIPATLVLALGYLGWQKLNFRKAVRNEIMDDIIKAKANKDQAQKMQQTEQNIESQMDTEESVETPTLGKNA